MYPACMGDERVTAAIGRIERALARIDSLPPRPAVPPAPPPHPGDDGRAAVLEAANRAFRSKVEGAIAQIDRLLEGG
jgi:hypothetical protein